MDEIALIGLPFFAYHGVMPEENVVGQRFVANVWMRCDLSIAGRTDDVVDTVNYAQAYEVIQSVVEGEVKCLIEAVAERVCDALFNAFPPIQQLTVEIEKPGAPIHGVFSKVSVRIHRDRPTNL